MKNQVNDYEEEPSPVRLDQVINRKPTGTSNKNSRTSFNFSQGNLLPSQVSLKKQSNRDEDLYDEPKERVFYMNSNPEKSANQITKEKSVPINYTHNNENRQSQKLLKSQEFKQADDIDDDALMTHDLMEMDREEETNEVQKSPHPTITITSKRQHNGSNINMTNPTQQTLQVMTTTNGNHGPNNNTVSYLSNRNNMNLQENQSNRDYGKQSDKSVGVNLDTSLKPRKGDQTPKSNRSQKKEHGHGDNQNNNQQNQQNYASGQVESPDKVNTLRKNLNNNILQAEHTGNFAEFEGSNLMKESLSGLKKSQNQAKQAQLGNSIHHKREPSGGESFQREILQGNYNLPNFNDSNLGDKKAHSSMINQDQHYSQYDIQQLCYDLVKEYSHLKIDKDESFMRRMLFDVFKRQTKEERMNKLVERNKVKIDENERVKTFNRLIEDANRRLEAQEKMEQMKDKLDENLMVGNSAKKYKFEEWEEIYEERFIKYKQEREKKIEEKVQEKLIKEKEKEDEIVETVKTKKVPQHVLVQIVNRMYEEADRRKIRLEEHRKKHKSEEEEEEENDDDMNFIKENVLNENKYKKFKKAGAKYNFQSDMSGNEQSVSEDESQKIIKQNKPKKITNSNTNPYKISERLYQNTTKNLKNRKSQIESNTEFNNKRFDGKDKHDRHSISNSVIKEEETSINKGPYRSESMKKIVRKHSGSYNKPIGVAAQTRYKVNEHLEELEKVDKEISNMSINNEDEEEVVRDVPRPIDNHVLNSANKKLKVNDFRKSAAKPNLSGQTPNNNYNSYKNPTNQLHMPDFVASKLVSDIMQKRLNES